MLLEGNLPQRLDLTPPDAAALCYSDQPVLLQEAKILLHVLQIPVQRFGQLVDRARVLCPDRSDAFMTVGEVLRVQLARLALG